MDDVFRSRDAEVQRPASRHRLHTAYAPGAHDAIVRHAAVAIEHTRSKPELCSAQIAAEHATVQRDELRVSHARTRHSHGVKSTIANSGLCAQLEPLRLARRGLR